MYVFLVVSIKCVNLKKTFLAVWVNRLKVDHKSKEQRRSCFNPLFNFHTTKRSYTCASFNLLNLLPLQLWGCEDVLNHICIKLLLGFPVILNTTKEVPEGTVIVAWEAPFEDTCAVFNYTVNHREVLSRTKQSKWHSVPINRNVTSLTLKLSCKTEYDIAVTSLSGYGKSALNESKIWNFKTGGGNVASSIHKTWEFQH